MIPVINATLCGAHGGDSPLVVDSDLELSISNAIVVVVKTV